MKTLALAIGFTLAVSSLPVSASTIRLYELGEGLTPDTSTADSGPYLTSGGLMGGGTQTSLGSGGTNLDTTLSNGIAAGYSNRVGNFTTNPFTPGAFVNSAFPVLDRNTGFTLQFNVAVLSEFRTNQNRAGFSVIALSSDAQGIELGFQDNGEGGTIFAQNSNFTFGESVGFSISSPTIYDLTILGNTYTLSSGGSQLLTNNLRSYNAAAVFNPYQTPNFIFLGDDTSSAQASINLGAVSLTTTAVPFEFSPILGLGLIGVWGIARKFKSEKLKK